jgi:hypothetical protein
LKFIVTNNVKIAIKGALNSFQGFGDFIASSAAFSSSRSAAEAIDAIDRDFSLDYEKYPPPYYPLTQLIGIPASIEQENCFLVLRAKKQFTNFPEQNRFYERREYFYYTLKDNIDSIAFVKSLPGMQDYAEKQFGKIPAFPVLPISDRSSFHLFSHFLSVLFKKATILQKISPENDESVNNTILSLIHTLPAIWKKYTGFGLNIKSDSSWLEKPIHIVTTLDENGNDFFSATGGQIDAVFDEFCQQAFNNDLKYTDRELTCLSPGGIQKDDLYKLLDFHWLHFGVDKYASGQYPETAKRFLSQSRQYVEIFLQQAFLDDNFIFERIIRIYQYWSNNEMLDVELSNWFWKTAISTRYSNKLVKHIFEDFSRYIEKEIRTITHFAEVDSTYKYMEGIALPSQPALSLLDHIKLKYLDQRSALPESSVGEIINYLLTEPVSKYSSRSLPNVLTKFTTFEAASPTHIASILVKEIDNLDTTTVNLLLTDTDLPEIFKILDQAGYSLLKKHEKIKPLLNEFLSVGKIDNSEDFSEHLTKIESLKLPLQKLSSKVDDLIKEALLFIRNGSEIHEPGKFIDGILAHPHLFDKANVGSFVSSLVENNKNLTIPFLDKVFRTADRYSFSIDPDLVKKYEPSLQDDWLNYIIRNRKYFSDDGFVIRAANLYLSGDTLPYSVLYTKMAALKKNSWDFFLSQEETFLNRLVNAFKDQQGDKKCEAMLFTTREIYSNRHNPFVKAGMPLYEEMLAITNGTDCDKKFIRSLYQVGKNLQRSGDRKQFADILLLIDQVINKYLLGDNKKKFRFTMKNILAFADRKLLVTCMLLGFFLLLTAYFLLKENKAENQSKDEIKTLQNELQVTNEKIRKQNSVNPVLNVPVIIHIQKGNKTEKYLLSNRDSLIYKKAADQSR